MLDVRSDNERLVGTVPGAVEVLFGPRQWTERLVSPEDVDRFLGEIQKLFANKRTRIIVFCNVGVRARAAGARLVTNGYTNVMIVRDGFLGNQFGEGLEAAAFE